jgi:general secretion pathway protein L
MMAAHSIGTFVAPTMSFIRAAMRWWLGELRAIIPASLFRAIRPAARWSFVDVEPGGRVVLPLAPPRRRGKVALRLDPCLGLKRSVTVPMGAESKLRSVMAFELERVTPFTVDQVFFDHRVLDRDAAAGRLTVELLVLPRAVVEYALSAARASGLEPIVVGLREADDGLPSFNVVGAGREAQRLPRQTVALSFVALLLVVIASALWVHRQWQGGELLDRRVETARRAARDVDGLRKEIGQVQEQRRFLNARAGQPRIIEIIRELTRVMPDGTWVYDLQLNGRDITLAGYAPSAASLIERLAGAAAFVNARFRSPVTQGPKGLERFDLSLEVR